MILYKKLDYCSYSKIDGKANRDLIDFLNELSDDYNTGKVGRVFNEYHQKLGALESIKTGKFIFIF
jgi:hypothetical protein